MNNRYKKRSICIILGKLKKKVILKISKEYATDYKVKKLPAHILFLCILATEILKDSTSLRDFQATYESPEFQKYILQAMKFKSITFVAFHYRLKSVDYKFFKRLFEGIRNEFNRLYRSRYKKYLNLPTDSTVVLDSEKVLKNGYKTTGKGDKNQIKFTVVFNGEIPISIDCYTERKYNSENVALAETILGVGDIKEMNENAGKVNFIFDRGMQKRAVYDEMTDKGIYFIGRVNCRYRIEIIKGIPPNEGSNIKKEEIGYLYHTGHNKQTKHVYRVITFPKEDGKEDIVVATNIPEADISAEEIAKLYRERWDIEIFFRFIKQTVHFSHLVSRDINGIMSMMYIRMICAILLITFRKLNNIEGYKDTKRALSVVILKEFAMLVEQKGPLLK